ncbi:MAG: hypothetical protein JW982_15995 [Spirochaetes bacterium]|nr:hypothetical protein [Spirochaetota bacterium]
MRSGIFNKKNLLSFITLFLILSAAAVFAQNDAAAPADNPALTTDELPSDLGGWRVEDYKPYITALKDLEKLTKEYSDNILNQAVDEYSKGIDILEDMNSEVETTKQFFAKRRNLSERWYWQEIDRKNQEKRQIAKLKYEAKGKAITHFTRAINLMDQVLNIEVIKDQAFINFQISLFQSYVSSQYDIHNLKPCIPILEKYISINETTKKDIWAYRYMASCYGYMEAVLKQYRNNGNAESLSIEFKQKKNKALLTAAELQYGVESTQYKHLKEVVEFDEKKSYQINDFK